MIGQFKSEFLKIKPKLNKTQIFWAINFTSFGYFHHNLMQMYFVYPKKTHVLLFCKYYLHKNVMRG